MTTLAPKTKFAAAKKFLLALPCLAILTAMVPTAQADQHYGYYRRHGYHRQHHYRSEYRHRHHHYRHSRAHYGYAPGYYTPRPGVSISVGL